MAEKPKMYRAFTVIPRKGQEDFWLSLGAAFPHEDGQGFNILFQALPIPRDGECKVILRIYDPEANEEAVEDAKKVPAKKK
jgi:hypothetical protein